MKDLMNLVNDYLVNLLQNKLWYCLFLIIIYTTYGSIQPEQIPFSVDNEEKIFQLNLIRMMMIIITIIITVVIVIVIFVIIFIIKW